MQRRNQFWTFRGETLMQWKWTSTGKQGGVITVGKQVISLQGAPNQGRKGEKK